MPGTEPGAVGTPLSTPPDTELVWSVSPFARERAKGASVVLLVLAVTAVTFVFGGVVIGMFAVLILVGGVGPFYVTTRYRLTPDGVEVKSPFQKVKRPWADFHRAYRGANGVSLSPFAGKHLLEPYRSVMLRYGNHQEAVLAWVRRYGPQGKPDGVLTDDDRGSDQ